MSFADSLNSKVNDYNNRVNKVPSESEIVSQLIKKYTSEIKELCVSSAERGQRKLQGFFIPQWVDNDYETTTEGPFIIDKPKSHANERPSKNILYGGMMYGNLDLYRGAIAQKYIERIRIGVLNGLTNSGFKKLRIEHLSGNKYALKKLVFSEIIASVGMNHYLYVDIEW